MSTVYEYLGIKTIINASGSMTELGGTILEPIVAQAMAEASQYYVHLPTLISTVEDRISELLQIASVCVCACASAAISLSAAACITETDPQKIISLPNTYEWPNVFLAPETHRNKFDQAIRIAGGVIRYFKADKAALKQLVADPSVVGLYYTMSWFCQGEVIPLSEAAQIAHQYGKPLIVDAAAQLPPIENFQKFLEEGADLVIFSGGKTLKGPQVSALILGKKELIQACKLNASPNIQTIGRGMKISKEEVVGLIYALEAYLKRDHQHDQDQWNMQLWLIKEALDFCQALQIQLKYPPGPGYQIPYLEISWVHEQCPIVAEQLLHQLRKNSTPIYARLNHQSEKTSSILIYAHTLKEAEEVEIAQALTAVFASI